MCSIIRTLFVKSIKKKGRNHNVFYHWNRLCEINKLLTRIDHNFLDASKLNAHGA